MERLEKTLEKILHGSMFILFFIALPAAALMWTYLGAYIFSAMIVAMLISLGIHWYKTIPYYIFVLCTFGIFILTSVAEQVYPQYTLEAYHQRKE